MILSSSAVSLEWILAPAYARCVSVGKTKHDVWTSIGRAGDSAPTSCGFTSSSISTNSPTSEIVAFFHTKWFECWEDSNILSSGEESRTGVQPGIGPGTYGRTLE